MKNIAIIIVCVICSFALCACMQAQCTTSSTTDTTISTSVATNPTTSIEETTTVPAIQIPLREDLTYIAGLSMEENLLYRLEICNYITELFGDLAAIELMDPYFCEKSNIIVDKIKELQDLDKQYLQDYLDMIEKQSEIAAVKNNAGLPEEVFVEYLGEFRLTAYCPCEECSEGWGSMTSTGVLAKENHTIAVDPTVIPYGSKIIINGIIYTAEDCGGAVKNNIIDIYFNTHEAVSDFGVKENIKIYIIK